MFIVFMIFSIYCQQVYSSQKRRDESISFVPLFGLAVTYCRIFLNGKPL